MTERVLADESAAQGVVLLCGHDGNIRQIVHNDPGWADAESVGRPFTRLLAASSIEKGQLFLAKAVATGAAFDWELGLAMDGGVRLLQFAAASVQADAVMIVGATTRSAVLRYYDELMRINNEQANALRTALKVRASERLPERGAEVFDEMMRLNNELATVQRELTKKNIQLEQANQVKNQLLGMAAHDLRNPLGVIQSYSEMLLEDEWPISEDERRDFLRRIKRSSEFMLALINDLLDVSAIESGQFRIELRDVDITQLVTAIVDLNRVLARDKEIEIALEIAPDVPPLRADPLKIEQILHNLLSNAQKFSKRGTKVHVTLRPGEGGVWLTIADAGPGIPAAEIEGMFRPFQRASPQSTGGERSTGLGLAIVKRAVDGHGGRLLCDSVVGRGTTFSLWFPEHGPPTLRDSAHTAATRSQVVRDMP